MAATLIVILDVAVKVVEVLVVGVEGFAVRLDEATLLAIIVAVAAVKVEVVAVVVVVVVVVAELVASL